MIVLKTINEWYKQCIKLQIFIFSKKNKKFKNLKNGKKNVRWDPHLYILLVCKISTQNICRKV